jgi:UDP-glucose 4-epimerase
MKILVTGGAGFIGSHLTEELLKRKYQVIALDNLSTGRYENIEDLLKKSSFEFVEGDILNANLVDKLVEKTDAVFHLAAAVGVDLIVKKPLQSLTTNIKGSEIVLEAALRYHKKILIASTSEIYGKNVNGPLKETDDRILGSPLKTRWSYSTAKAVDEMLAYLYFKEKKLPAIIVRLFNTVGPRQTGAYGMVLPRFVEQALSDKPITVYGTGRQSRCFLHVTDAVRALIGLIEEPLAVGGVFNIGSQEEITIGQLAEEIIKSVGSKSGIVYIPYEKAYEEGFEDMQRRVPDIAKINKLIGFRPTFTLSEIVTDIVAYLKPAANFGS